MAGKIVFNSAEGVALGEMDRGACVARAAAIAFSGSQAGRLVPTGSVIGVLPAIGLAYEIRPRLERLLAAGTARAQLRFSSGVHPSTAVNIVAEIPGPGGRRDGF